MNQNSFTHKHHQRNQTDRNQSITSIGIDYLTNSSLASLELISLEDTPFVDDRITSLHHLVRAPYLRSNNAKISFELPSETKTDEAQRKSIFSLADCCEIRLGCYSPCPVNSFADFSPFGEFNEGKPRS